MPPRTEAGKGRRLALVIATAAYGDRTLAKLRAPGSDAAELAGVLGDASIGGFEVETVLDAPTERVRRQVAQFCAQLGPSDLALVYLSCHGVLDDRGRLYYATTDTDRALLSATAVPSAWLNEQLEDCRSRRQILILDCCHSGAFAKGAKGEGNLALGQRFEGRGRVVLTGSRGTEYSFEHDRVVGDAASSVFTGALVAGLRSGEADRDGDGLVTVSELYDYAYDTVRETEARQTPTLWTYGAEGDLLVAQNPRGALVEPVPRTGAPDAAPSRAGGFAPRAIPLPAPGAPPAEPPSSPSSPPSAPAWRAPGGRRRLAVIGAGVVALAGVAIAVALSAGSGSDPAPRLGPATYEVSGEPQGIAVDQGTIWVAQHRTGEVSWIDPAGHRKSRYVGPDPTKIAAGEGFVWVAIENGKKMVRLEPDTLAPAEEVTVAPGTCKCLIEELVIGEGKLWVGSVKGHSITAFDLESGREVGEPHRLDGEFEGVFAVGDEELWALGNDEGTSTSSLFQVPAESRGFTPFHFQTTSYLSGVAWGEETVWIVDAENGRNLVSAFDPEEGEIVKELPLGNVLGDDIAVSGGTVFVWDPYNGVLSLIDASAKKLEGEHPVKPYRRFEEEASYHSDLAVEDGVAWVTDPVGETVNRVAY